MNELTRFSLLVLLFLLAGMSVAPESALCQTGCLKAGLHSGGWTPPSGAPLLTTLGSDGVLDICGDNVADGNRSFAFRFLEGCADTFVLPGRDLDINTTNDNIMIVRWTLHFRIKAGRIDDLIIFLRDVNGNRYQTKLASFIAPTPASHGFRMSPWAMSMSWQPRCGRTGSISSSFVHKC